MRKRYEPQLRKGIKIAIDLVNSVQQDKKDGDVDVKVRIAPNNVELETSIIQNNDYKGQTPKVGTHEVKEDNPISGIDIHSHHSPENRLSKDLAIYSTFQNELHDDAITAEPIPKGRKVQLKYLRLEGIVRGALQAPDWLGVESDKGEAFSIATSSSGRRNSSSCTGSSNDSNSECSHGHRM